MNYKYHITRAVDSSANENHEKYDSDVSYDDVSRYGRAPDMNKYRDVMDYVQSFNLIPLKQLLLKSENQIKIS